MNKNEEKGVTLIVLVITIIILSIIASIVYFNGKEVIQKAKLESLKTNMLLIQAKAKECVENATFKMGINPDEAKKNEARNQIYIDEYNLIKVSDKTDLSIPSDIIVNESFYYVTSETLAKMGLDKIEIGNENGEYLIEFKEDENKAEIYNTVGYKGKYSLTDLQNIEL